jgi:hypothetical protein
MIIKNVNENDLLEALKRVNTYFPRMRFSYDTPELVSLYLHKWKVRLQTRWAGCPGTLLGVNGRKRMKFACWHSTGLFLDALPKEAVIYANGRKIRPGEPWKDWKRGQNYMGNDVMQSALCRCPGKSSQEGFLEVNNINMNFIRGIPRVVSKVLSNWDNDVLERFELSRKRYDEGNLLNQLITGG